MDEYSSIAQIYDFWQEDNNNTKWANYIEKIIQKHFKPKKGDGENGNLIVLDLGCGTGDFALEMSKRGYETIGIDKSMDMLNKAKEKSDAENVVFVCQDITNFELFGTVDIIVCLLDTINHLKSKKDLDKMFSLCKNYLNPKGLLVFDLATQHYFQNILGDNTFFDLRDEYTVIWENQYNKKLVTNYANLTYFIKKNNGEYFRGEDLIKEKAFSPDLIDELTTVNKLKIIRKYMDFKFKKPDTNCERIFYVIENSIDEEKELLRKQLEGNDTNAR